MKWSENYHQQKNEFPMFPGEETKLTDPAAFEVKTLNNTTLPAEDKAALVEFHISPDTDADCQLPNHRGTVCPDLQAAETNPGTGRQRH